MYERHSYMHTFELRISTDHSAIWMNLGDSVVAEVLVVHAVQKIQGVLLYFHSGSNLRERSNDTYGYYMHAHNNISLRVCHKVPTRCKQGFLGQRFLARNFFYVACTPSHTHMLSETWRKGISGHV